MEVSKLPAWLLALSLFVISIGFVVSLYALDEPRNFAGLTFGPLKSKGNDTSANLIFEIKGSELPSNGGNAKSSLCPGNSYMIGARMQSDPGGPHGIVSTVIPVCRTLEISAK